MEIFIADRLSPINCKRRDRETNYILVAYEIEITVKIYVPQKPPRHPQTRKDPFGFRCRCAAVPTCYLSYLWCSRICYRAGIPGQTVLIGPVSCWCERMHSSCLLIHCVGPPHNTVPVEGVASVTGSNSSFPHFHNHIFISKIVTGNWNCSQNSTGHILLVKSNHSVSSQMNNRPITSTILFYFIVNYSSVNSDQSTEPVPNYTCHVRQII